nr:hypothetical protein [Tanacetum cinerariifolium]
MVAILEKIEHNTDFHQIVDFLEASHIQYALTISPTVYVLHIRQFWSTARIETTNQETKILATIDGKPQTIFESSLRIHLKLNDEEGISSLPDAELFENLSLMGYNILPNQRFTFQKGQFSHHRTVLLFASMIITQSKRSANPTEPHHIPSPQEQHLPHHDSPSPSHPTITSESIPQAPIEPLTHRQYTIRAIRIAQSKALSPATEEPASLSRDDRQGEAFPIVSSLDAGQDKENISKTSALPMNKESRSAKPTQEDAPITGGIMEIGEELGVDKSIELGSNDTEEMDNVLSSMEAANILTSGGAAASVSPGDVLPAAGVPTISGSFPTSMKSPIIGAKDKGKEKVVESEVPKKRKLQEQIDAQIMIEGLDKRNKVIKKHLREYEQAAADLSVGEKLKLISELVKYQDHRAKILKGMTLEQIKEKFIPVWKQYEDFIPMSSKEESERVKRQGLKNDQGSSKRIKTSKNVSEDVSDEELKGMMQLIPLEKVYVEALQVKHRIINWEIHSEGKREYWKIIRLGGHTIVYQ